jgi:thiosulfate reductase cytochrome b subunit
MFGYDSLVMVEPAYFTGLAIRGSETSDPPRHSGVIRITHWVTTLSFFGLLVSGIAILLSHPRLYWGETGSVETPSLIDLPIPFVLANQNGWGRYLHFLSAWVSVLTGLLYATSGILTQHFRKNLLPAKAHLAWEAFAQVVWSHLHLKRPSEEESLTYNVLQRLAYLAVVFALFPVVIWTGLAMSPAMTSVFPALVNVLGGQQSARTVHFFVAGLLVLFLLVHIAMVCLAGFRSRVGAMITGRTAGSQGDT